MSEQVFFSFFEKNKEWSFIQDNVRYIRNQLAISEIKRSLDFTQNTRLIAVSKYTSVEAVWAALHAGVFDFAESRSDALQEKQKSIALKFQETLDALDINSDYFCFLNKAQACLRWHFIGSIQKRKVKDIVGSVDLIHSLDRVRLAGYLQKEAEKKGIVQPVLIQINWTNEVQKSGFSVEDAFSFSKTFDLYKNLQFCGVMGMAEAFASEDRLQETFRGLQTSFQSIKRQLDSRFQSDFSECSMGMSHDYFIAVLEGATMVRIGSFIFEKEF